MCVCTHVCVQVCARREVRVTLPPRLELHCPPLTVVNQSLAVRLVSWGGEGVAVDWRITKDGQEAARGQNTHTHTHTVSSSLCECL